MTWYASCACRSGLVSTAAMMPDHGRFGRRHEALSRFRPGTASSCLADSSTTSSVESCRRVRDTSASPGRRCRRSAAMRRCARTSSRRPPPRRSPSASAIRRPACRRSSAGTAMATSTSCSRRRGPVPSTSPRRTPPVSWRSRCAVNATALTRSSQSLHGQRRRCLGPRSGRSWARPGWRGCPSPPRRRSSRPHRRSWPRRRSAS